MNGDKMDVNRVFKPYSIEGMKKEASRNTICETLRLAYKDIDSGNLEQAQLRIRIAVTMAKAMATKLKSYNAQFVKDLFPKKESK
jgi:hypothetical protein